ncbi:polyubiquitin-tagged protein recognition complex Npl4 component [Amylocystis lapponica]|nr:polyubiquitin-tagged protein recognition complex Npl4 component [Amylocystis lapponica]
MLVRVRSKDGNFRFELPPTADISELAAKIIDTAPEADPATLAISNRPRGNETLVSALKGRNLQALGIKHGELVFVSYKPRADAASDTGTCQCRASWESVQEDTVDVHWRSQDGMIPRERDSRFCKHGANAMCDYCMPLEPYDAAYHTEHSIKHLSYHAYLRKLTPKASTVASTAASLPPLSQLSFKRGHPPWPAGICTACQPSAITLQSQPFRMVDHLEIASMAIVDRFLQAWRSTGLQRFGWLLGRYEPYDKVPMGVKAVVEAIHEPPQEGELDGLSLGLPWEDEPRVRALAAASSPPLTIVGYIFTDLEPTPEDRTKIVYKRHPQSFYLSCIEALFAAQVQNGSPTASRASPSGLFASRMVTAVLTGTADGAIDACAMVAADMIEASVDPGIVRVKEEDRSVDSARYVPDVFFTYKNEYGLEVKKSAKPCFPVEYLLVNVSNGFPQTPSPLFHSTTFHIENRPGLEDQHIEGVLRDLSRLRAPEVTESRLGGDAQLRTALVKWLSDWHLIAFLGSTQLFSADDMKVLIRTATAASLEDPTILDALIGTDSWQTLMTFTRETAPPPRPTTSAPSGPSHSGFDEDIPQEIFDQIAREGGSGGGGGGSNVRVCPHCTFENTHGGGDCEVCGLPL